MTLHRRVKFDIRWIYVAFISISVFGWYVNTYSPDSGVKIIIFFFFVFGIVLSVASFLLNNVRRGVLCGIGSVIFLLLRILQLRDIVYTVLLIAALFSLEILLSKTDRNI